MSVLVLDKAPGRTSFGVVKDVACLLRAYRMRHPDAPDPRRIGHGGTLDPMATGVLPICIGEATKLAPFLLDAEKAYEAEVSFGVETDTLDAEGQVTARRSADGLTETRVRDALAAFRGPQDQVPPMYSALKKDGRRLYDRARAGEEVERAPRRVVIHELELLASDLPRVRLFVRCSKGTYVRSLAADLGRALGVGAHLSALRRTASGPFRIETALTVSAMADLVEQGADLPFIDDARVLDHLRGIVVAPEIARALEQGKVVPWATLGEAPPPTGPVRLLRQDGSLLAMASLDGGRVKTHRVFGLQR